MNIVSRGIGHPRLAVWRPRALPPPDNSALDPLPPSLQGESGVDQLVEIIKVLGTPTREARAPSLSSLKG